MASREPSALWEESLESTGSDQLADKIVELARLWANGNAELLREAERILTRTPYLKGGKPS